MASTPDRRGARDVERLEVTQPALLPSGVAHAQGRVVTLGVMGGGQLGRMFVHAAQSMGYAVAVLDPDATSPAGQAANVHVRTPYLDDTGLAALCEGSDAITTEFENVPASALLVMAKRRPVAPSGAAVAICQDRALEKRQFVSAGVPCAPHAVMGRADSRVDEAALLPGILKTTKLGYDGKGQATVRTSAELADAWQRFGGVSCVLEKKLDLEHEISVVLARDAQGTVVHLPVQQNLHRDGILAVTLVPAPDVSDALQAQALDAARRVAQAMQYVGVLCVEFFVVRSRDGLTLVANEMAPRPHNSGHHSIDSCDVSQFGLQVRTLAGLPLVPPRQHSPAVMLNLLGDLWFDAVGHERTPPWAEVLALPGAHLHLYGKTEARRGRKMGHLTFTAATLPEAKARALHAAAVLGLPSF